MKSVARLTLLLTAGTLFSVSPESLPAQAPGAADDPAQNLPADLQPVPFPDLAGLEEAVASQLRAAQDLLQELLSQSESAPRALGPAYGELGRLYHAYAFDEAAMACYWNARQLAPEDIRWSYYLAHLYQTTGRLDEAAETYRQVLALDPQNLPALVHLGEVHLAENRLEEAEVVFEKALEIDPSSPAARANLGQIALSRRRFQEAVEHLEAALRAVPEADRLHYPLALAYRGLGDHEKAREHLARRGMVGVRPPDPLIEELQQLKEGEIVHLLRGRMAFRVGRLEEAREAFSRAVAAGPGSVPARVNLGSTLALLGDRAGAMAQYREALQLDPDNPTSHFNLGILLAQDGLWAEAARHLERVVQVNPGDAEAQEQLAGALAALRRFDEAQVHYEKALALRPEDPDAYLGLADTLLRVGRYRQARDRLEEAHTLFPENSVATHALARFLAGSPDLALRDGNRALDLALRVFNAQQTVVHAETLAMALAEVGRCPEAAEWQQRVIDALRQTGQEERLPELEQTLAHYQGGAPCRYGVPRGTGSGDGSPPSS